MTSLFSSYNPYDNDNNDIEPTVVLISPENKSSSSFWIHEPVETRVISILMYIGFWIFILHGMETYKIGYPTSVRIGFTTGFILLIIYDYLYNSASQLMIDATEKTFAEMNILSTNIVLDDKVFKLNKTRGLVIKNSVFEKLKKEKKLNSISVQKYRDSEYIKTLGAQGDNDTPLAAYKHYSTLLLSGSYMFITVITACILASHHNKKLLAAMLPFATTSGVLAVAFISLWFVDRDYTGLITTEKMKSKIFITAFSFALTAIVTPFFIT